MNNRRQKDPRSGSGSRALRAIVHFSHIGVTVAASVFIGVFIGKYLDRLLGTSPWLLLIFSLLGVGAAVRSLFGMSGNKKQ